MLLSRRKVRARLLHYYPVPEPKVNPPATAGLGEINAANIQGSFFNLDYCNVMNVLPDHVYYEEGRGWMNEKSEGFYEVVCIGKVYYFRDHGADEDGCCRLDDSTDEDDDQSSFEDDRPRRGTLL